MKINQDFQHLFCAYKAKYSNVKHTLVFTSTYQCNRAQGAGGQFNLMKILKYNFSFPYGQGIIHTKH